MRASFVTVSVTVAIPESMRDCAETYARIVTGVDDIINNDAQEPVVTSYNERCFDAKGNCKECGYYLHQCICKGD